MKDTHKTNVAFFMATYQPIEADEQPFKEVIAVFVPDVLSNMEEFECYVHLGQHSTCSQSFLRENCRKATEKEYKELFNELENQVGYNLNVV